jgi:hypothetical protein
VPIPFHDVGDVEELGSAGFLKLEPFVGENQVTVGAVAGLLVINARGEPLEFAFNRVELRHPMLLGRAACSMPPAAAPGCFAAQRVQLRPTRAGVPG